LRLVGRVLLLCQQARPAALGAATAGALAATAARERQCRPAQYARTANERPAPCRAIPDDRVPVGFHRAPPLPLRSVCLRLPPKAKPMYRERAPGVRFTKPLCTSY